MHECWVVGFFSAVQGFAFMERIYNSTKSACLLVGRSVEVGQYGEVVSHTSQAGKDLEVKCFHCQEWFGTKGEEWAGLEAILRNYTQRRSEKEAGQHDTYLGKRRYNQVIAMSGEKREKKHFVNAFEL